MERTRGYVVVDGWGPVAEEVAAQLRRLGVRVRAGGHAADAAELDVVGGGSRPGAVLLVTGHEPAWVRCPSMHAPWHAHGVAHLPVRARPGGVDVGPLVLPGRSPCLGCVAARLDDPPTERVVPPAGGDDGVLVLAASVATVVTLSALRGDTHLAAISTEVAGAGPTVRHRVWSARPRCGCGLVRVAG